LDGGVTFLNLSAFGLGLRHGVDWDHMAAITDITGAEYRRRRAAWFALLYAFGHGAAVFVLGALAVVAGEQLPSWTDAAMERVVGVTLLALAAALARSLWTGEPARVSRGMFLLHGLAAFRDRLRRTRRVDVEHDHGHEHDARHAHEHPDGARAAEAAIVTTHRHHHVHAVEVSRYTAAGAMAVGVLHGVGAETGTQAVVLVSASHVGNAGDGVVVLAGFVAGIVVTTGVLALGAAYGWASLGARETKWLKAVTALTALTSAAIGAFYVTGHAAVLPGLFG
jgi:high-affinity nickel-transport protein